MILLCTIIKTTKIVWNVIVVVVLSSVLSSLCPVGFSTCIVFELIVWYFSPYFHYRGAEVNMPVENEEQDQFYKDKTQAHEQNKSRNKRGIQ